MERPQKRWWGHREYGGSMNSLYCTHININCSYISCNQLQSKPTEKQSNKNSWFGRMNEEKQWIMKTNQNVLLKLKLREIPVLDSPQKWSSILRLVQYNTVQYSTADNWFLSQKYISFYCIYSCGRNSRKSKSQQLHLYLKPIFKNLYPLSENINSHVVLVNQSHPLPQLLVN